MKKCFNIENQKWSSETTLKNGATPKSQTSRNVFKNNVNMGLFDALFKKKDSTSEDTDKNEKTEPLEIVVQSNTFSDLIMPCKIESPACTHPEKNGIITLKKSVQQLNVCESCYNYMIENKKWIKSSWD